VPGHRQPSTVSRYGTFIFKITVNIASNLPLGTKPYCSASVKHSTGSVYYSENASTNVTPSGNTAICNLRIPYLWPSANDVNGVSPSVYVSTNNRYLSQNLPPIKLPPNGTTRIFQATVRSSRRARGPVSRGGADRTQEHLPSEERAAPSLGSTAECKDRRALPLYD
jgi:hypothetical protein